MRFKEKFRAAFAARNLLLLNSFMFIRFKNK